MKLYKCATTEGKMLPPQERMFYQLITVSSSTILHLRTSLSLVRCTSQLFDNFVKLYRIHAWSYFWDIAIPIKGFIWLTLKDVGLGSTPGWPYSYVSLSTNFKHSKPHSNVYSYPSILNKANCPNTVNHTCPPSPYHL